MQSLTIRTTRERSQYPIRVGGELRDSGPFARECLGDEARGLVVVSNKKVFDLYGREVVENLRAAGFETVCFLVGDGERYKTFRTAESVLSAMAEARLTRTDAVVALGGGVVGDVSGFAAAVYLRGIRFIQIPTTLLAMIDSSVGGKTGVNSAGGKNLTGAFHQPSGVLIDPSVLATLAAREFSAGMFEAVKHAAIGPPKLLGLTREFLEAGNPTAIGSKNLKSEISNLIFENIKFKARIVAGDERESAGRRDSKSRKILNFGHTLAHALEKVTAYKLLRHGEAVGYGIMFAVELSKNLALCDKNDVELLNDVVRRVGPLPRLANIDQASVIEAFSFDKKQLAGSLQMVLLSGIGKPVLVGGDAIRPAVVKTTLSRFLRQWS